MNRSGVPGSSTVVARQWSNYPRNCAKGLCGWSLRCGRINPSGWSAIVAVAGKPGIGTAETLRRVLRQAEVDAGQWPGVASEDSAEIKRLKRENAKSHQEWSKAARQATSSTARPRFESAS
jgi:hypothetical protein